MTSSWFFLSTLTDRCSCFFMTLRVLARFEVMAAALLGVHGCWDVTLCRFINSSRLFEEPQRFRLHSAHHWTMKTRNVGKIFTDWLILAFQKTSLFSVAFLCPAFLSVVFISPYYLCFCPPALPPLLYLQYFEVSPSTHLSLGDNDNER